MSASTDDQGLNELAQSVAVICLARNELLVTAESCTAGWIAKVLTDLSGSSAWFEGGVVTYSDALKRELLGVSEETLRKFGAVSGETAVEMVSGALEKLHASIAVAVTGIAGPSGGTADKPVGTVWIGWKLRDGEPRAERFRFDGDREAVRRQTVAAALRGVVNILQDRR